MDNNNNNNNTTGSVNKSPISPIEESSFRNRFAPIAGGFNAEGSPRAADMSDHGSSSSAAMGAHSSDSPVPHLARTSSYDAGHQDARNGAQRSPATAQSSTLWPRPAEFNYGSSPSLASSKKSTSVASLAEQQLPDHQEQSEKTTAPGLTFYQKYFTKPVCVKPEVDPQLSKTRRFSFLSLGSLLSLLLLVIILAAIIASAVTVTLQNEKTERRLERERQSPVRLAILDNFPDPSITFYQGTWYAYATNNAAGILEQPANRTRRDRGLANVQLATSDNFHNWTQWNFTNDPLPKVGRWARQGPFKLQDGLPPIPDANVWAPAVVQNGTGDWIMYYSAAITKDTSDIQLEKHAYPERIDPQTHPLPHCVGASISESGTPFGPFRPLNATFACQVDRGGVIDPAAIRDFDGSIWVTYKIDGNSIGVGGECNNGKAPQEPTPIMLQKMHPDGITPDGDPIQILDREDIDGPLVEAPEIVRSHEGKYFLFFSSGCTRDSDYNVKYAYADKITGPYVRAEGKLLQTGDWGLISPGSVGIHDDTNGGFNMVFHARVSTSSGKVRAMYSTKLQFDGDGVKLVRDTFGESTKHGR
ncbi:glycoside hydrolase family 43 protein [Polychaeton citri CBS 116435]|uniref:Glycoside hydrolase family 43 protein n=1 Tax=Polychaeton citri CBS 116435 TaxID=1314669 RepID=A0A9P4QEP3_9PEZI|nr:glycoside hydrolase family 43 protein [Polychaeton citri CBS 116435]